MVLRWWLMLVGGVGGVAPLGAQQTGALTGTVFQARSRRPLAGARVAVPSRSDLVVHSDSSGTFQLFHLPVGLLRVTVALPGYATVVETVPIGDARVTEVDFELTEVGAVLDQVVTVGARRPAEGSRVEEVRSLQLEATGGATVGAALAQHLAGGEVLWSSGQVGAGASIILRGLKSWRLSSHPVVYVDGVRLAEPSGRGVSDARSSALDFIDASTVERIEVVRGPAALRYGADAAGGVVLISTKRGSSQP